MSLNPKPHITNFCVNILIIYEVTCTSSYYIRNGAIPSFLYAKFENVKEEVFPHDIRIKISLSKIGGTLFYSIDKLNNQLIVSLQNGMSPTLAIEFSGQSHYLSLSKLCGNDRCIFDILDLRIQMRDSMYVQCGERQLEIIKYDRSKQLNKKYPIPYKNMSHNDGSLNEAHLWLVNNPQYGDVYPNNQQLSGCIFNVSYNNREIIFSNITANIRRECAKTCIGNICNGGQCYETYNTEPVCNCTLTFLNGRYCNDTISAMNLQSVSQMFIFDMFKLSWNSPSVHKKFIVCKNNYMSIRLVCDGQQLVIIFEYYNKNGLNTTIRSNLSHQYLAYREWILIAYFQEYWIFIQLGNNGSWSKITIPTTRDLRTELFDSISLESGQGIIGLVYKTSQMDTKWRPINFVKPANIATIGDANDKQNPIKRSSHEGNENFTTMIVLITVMATLGFFLVLVVCLTNIFGSSKFSHSVERCIEILDLRGRPQRAGKDQSQKDKVQ